MEADDEEIINYIPQKDNKVKKSKNDFFDLFDHGKKNGFSQKIKQNKNNKEIKKKNSNNKKKGKNEDKVEEKKVEKKVEKKEEKKVEKKEEKKEEKKVEKKFNGFIRFRACENRNRNFKNLSTSKYN